MSSRSFPKGNHESISKFSITEEVRTWPPERKGRCSTLSAGASTTHLLSSPLAPTLPRQTLHPYSDFDSAIGTTPSRNTSNSNDNAAGSQNVANGQTSGNFTTAESCRDCERLARANAELSRLLPRMSTPAAVSSPLPPPPPRPLTTATTRGDGRRGEGCSSAPTLVVGADPSADEGKVQQRRTARKIASLARKARSDGSGSPIKSSPLGVKPSSTTVVGVSNSGRHARKQGRANPK